MRARVLSAAIQIAVLILAVSGPARGNEEIRPAEADMAYPGGELPGRVPEIFAPGLISGAGYRLHGSVVFSTDLRQVCWTVVPPAVMTSSFAGGKWSEAAPMPLEGRGVHAPSFSPDGRRLYYQCALEGGRGSIDIWWIERTGDGWGAPVNAGPNVNTAALESQPSLTADGTLYYTGTLEGAGLNRGIYRSRLVDGEYGKPELLGGSINGKHIDYCPWIAPDESYLLFASSRPRTEEPLYLHISFRQQDGSWSEPENIHPVLGFEGSARFPSVSPDGRFLFFVSGKNIYWVDIAGVMGMRGGVPEAG